MPRLSDVSTSEIGASSISSNSQVVPASASEQTLPAPENTIPAPELSTSAPESDSTRENSISGPAFSTPLPQIRSSELKRVGTFQKKTLRTHDSKIKNPFRKNRKNAENRLGAVSAMAELSRVDSGFDIADVNYESAEELVEPSKKHGIFRSITGKK
eukprot:894366_1